MTPQFIPAENMPHFVIQGTLPSLNEYLSACGKHPLKGANMKKSAMNDCIWFIRSGLKGWQAEHPLIIHYIFYEPNKKRDKDNLFSMASKCICDALQKCNVIKNDGWKDIENFTHDFYIDTDNPRIEVYLEEIREGDKVL